MNSSGFDEKDLWPVEAGVGEIIYPPGGNFGPRQQNNVQLVMLYTGEMTVWVDNQKKFAPAGTVCLLLPGHKERFAFAPDCETHHSWLHAYLPDLPPLLEQRLKQLPWSLPLSPFMSTIISQALQINSSFNPAGPAILKAMTAQMLWLYIGEGEIRKENLASMRQHPAITGALQFIQVHLQESLTLELIAGHIGVSPTHLIRLFRNSLGTTVMAFVWQQRVNLGINLLENTGLSVGIIAERCGFQNGFHFSRRIRQATGASPLELRSQMWHRKNHS